MYIYVYYIILCYIYIYIYIYILGRVSAAADAASRPFAAFRLVV